MSQNCPSCGSEEIEQSESGSETRLVCTSCGTIIDDCSALTSVTGSGTNFVSKDGTCIPSASDRHKKVSNTGVPTGKRLGVAKIMHLSSLYNLSYDTKQDARYIFIHAFNDAFRRETFKRKYILAGCCVYIVMRRCGYSVTCQDLCNQVDCTPKEFRLIMKRLENYMGTKVPSQTTGELLRTTLKDVIMDDKEKLIKKAMEILTVCYQCFLVTGQSRVHNIIAAVYIAWVCLDFSRLNTKFAKFYTKFEFPKAMARTAAHRFQEIASVFIRHAQKLPWVESTVDVKNFCLHVDHVLQSFNSLHDEVLASAGSPDGGAGSEENEDKLVYKTFRPESSAKTRTPDCPETAVNIQDDGAYLSEDISDTEIETYIRTDKEVVEYVKFRNLVEAYSSGDVQT